MRNLTATICLTIAVFLGSAEVSSANSNRKANDAMRCAAIYMIATSVTANNKAATKAFADLQRIFIGVYSNIKGQERRLTNGDISRAKSSQMTALGKIYDRNPSYLYKLEMRCNSWRAVISETISDLSRSSGKVAIQRAFQNLALMPDISSGDSRWPRSKKLVDMSIAAWTKGGRMTPQRFKESLRKSLRR